MTTKIFTNMYIYKLFMFVLSIFEMVDNMLLPLLIIIKNQLNESFKIKIARKITCFDHFSKH